MRIKTQFIIGMIVFGGILLLISTSVIVRDRQVEGLNRQRELANSLERDASDLSYLSYDYLLYHENQQRSRWESRFASFTDDLSKLTPTNPEQQALVNNLKVNQQRLRAVFTDVTATIERDASSGTMGFDPAFIQVAWSRIQVQTLGIAFDASRLFQLFDEQAGQWQQANLNLILVLIGVFGLYFLTNYYLVYRRTLSGIADLQTGTEIIGSGNLEFAVEEKRDDEIGDLGRAFNRMTADLKRVTASKGELEQEIAERERAEESLRQALGEIQRLNLDLEQRAEELEAANKELEAFAYSISHDLRTPLAATETFARLLAEECEGQLSPEGQSYLQLLRENSSAMGRLIAGLLSFSRTTRQPLKKQTVPAMDLVRRVVAELGPSPAERRGEIVIGDLPVCEADPTLLRQVWVNLLSNALKFTRQCETPRIEIGYGAPGAPGAYYVKDNGVGFDMAEAGKLFGVFQRLHSEEEFEGTGVGLAIVDRIIRRHGGRVWAQAQVDQGATFFFTLA